MEYSPSQYAQTLYDLLEENPRKSKEIIRAFAQKLVSNGNSKDFRVIVSAFEREWYLRKNIVRVEVTSAEASAFTQKELEKTIGKEIELIEKTDPSVVAGARIKIGDYQIDNTLTRRLSDLKQALTR